MSLTIELPEQLERELQDRSRSEGKSTSEYVRDVLRKQFAPRKSLDEILAPFRQSFAESGTTEEELDALVEEAREEIWREQQEREAKT